MIRKLRGKIVSVIMLTVLSMLLVIFGAFFTSVSRSIADDSQQVLQRVMLETELSRLPGFGSVEDIQIPYFCVSVSNGTATVLSGGYFDLNNRTHLLAIINACMEQEEDSGVLRDYRLRYLRAEKTNATQIAFVDTSMEESMMRNMLMSSFYIGLSALVLFFVLSVLFARWAVRPVEQTLQQQRRFIADASHELKTPLTVILANTDLLQTEEEITDTQRRRWLENIHSESRRMKRLVEEMLTLTRTEDAREKADFAELNFSDLLLDCILLFDPVAFEAGKQLEYDLQPELMLQGSDQQLQQLCGILLDNAIKYAPEGGVVRLRLQQGKHVSFSITNPNRGEPIPPEKLEHLFDRFYRADESRSGEGSFGLGLSIAAAIVQQHKGRIWAESNENGTTFRVELPKRK